MDLRFTVRSQCGA